MSEWDEWRESPGRTAGVSVAWIAIWGALIGATTFVPLFPYVGGGGFLPLSVAFSAIAPLVLGPAGILAALIGGIIGAFLSPASFPLGPIDVLVVGMLPAVLVYLMTNGQNRVIWVLNIIVIIGFGIWVSVFPYYVPGPPTFSNPTNPGLFFALGGWYWIPWLIIQLSPLGWKYIPEWARQTEIEGIGKKFVGLLIAVMSSVMVWLIPFFLPFWFLFVYPVDLGQAVFIGYSWWGPAFSVVITVISIPIVEGLHRSGLPRVPGALW
jgi:hypothetical protein